MYIQNFPQLTDHGNRSLRGTAAEIIDHALSGADPYAVVKRSVHLDGETLHIADRSLELKDYDRIFTIGAGKASRGIAVALEEVLGDRICDGVFVLKHGDRVDLKHTRVIYAAHPVPDENSLLGAQEIMTLAETFTARDLVFAGITGGSSALLALPAADITLDELQTINQLMLLSGADIVQINSVRKHLSRIKGGLLARAILPATLINLTVSDVVGDMLDYITGPTVPDTSTFADARRVLDEHELWETFPASAAAYLRQGDEALETPKNFDGYPLHTILTVAGDAACLAAAEKAAELGFKPMILTSLLGGEAKDAGSFFAAIGKEITTFQRPLKAPCAIIAAGENVVTIGSTERGNGGPNQEFALAASLEIAGMDNVVIAAVDTDGYDGSSGAAGAMVDGETEAVAEAMGHDPIRQLRRHDIADMLSEIGDAVHTGPTGTNVNDLKVMLVT